MFKSGDSDIIGMQGWTGPCSMNMSHRKGFLTRFFWISLVYLLSGLLAPGLLAERRIEEISLASGCRLIKVWDSDIPLGYCVLEADLREPGIGLLPVIAQDLFPGRESIRFMSLRYDRPERRVIGGVNADFWQVAAPVGMTVVRGQLVRSPNARSTFAISGDNDPQIEVFRLSITIEGKDFPPIKIDSVNRFRSDQNAVIYTRVNGRTTRTRGRGIEYILDPQGRPLPASGIVSVNIEASCPRPHNNDIPSRKWILSIGKDLAARIPRLDPGAGLKLRVETHPHQTEVFHAVSGGPRILRDGIVSVEIEREAIRAGFDTERHPRTAVGFSKDRRLLYFCVVDGRQGGYSRGVSLFELAELMREYGCHQAMNLDGGGSSSMIANGTIVNRPSDLTGIRPVSSGIFIISRSPQH